MTSKNITSGWIRALRRKMGDGAKAAESGDGARAAPDAWPGAPPTWSSLSEQTVRLAAGRERDEVLQYIVEHWHEDPACDGPAPRLSFIAVERIQNLRQWRQHELFSKSLQPPAAASTSTAASTSAATARSAAPRWLFHGAPAEVVPKIIAQVCCAAHMHSITSPQVSARGTPDRRASTAPTAGASATSSEGVSTSHAPPSTPPTRSTPSWTLPRVPRPSSSAASRSGSTVSATARWLHRLCVTGSRCAARATQPSATAPHR
jgi:hypothetical protein